MHRESISLIQLSSFNNFSIFLLLFKFFTDLFFFLSSLFIATTLLKHHETIFLEKDFSSRKNLV